MSTALLLVNGATVSIFGILLAASFSDVLNTRRNRWIFCAGLAALLLLQGLVSFLFTASITRRLYPFTAHLPLLLFLYMRTHKPLWAVLSVLFAYLCCQLRRWLALLPVALFAGGETELAVAELILTIPLFLLLHRFVSPLIRPLSKYPARMQRHFAVIPALYYAFDYLTRIYTDLLSGGSAVVVEFMPFVCCAAYLVFLHHNFTEEQTRLRLLQTQKTLDIQLSQAMHEINALRESQNLARQYRHDLRHHLQYISSCIQNGQAEQAQSYIAAIHQQIHTQEVQRFCENEAANLVFSAFHDRAAKDGISLRVQGALPASIPLSENDLCVLLSNSLENALHACQALQPCKETLLINVNLRRKDERLFFQISNPCRSDIRFEKGLPVSDQPDHGIGVQSICSIVQRYGGLYSFQVKDGHFVLIFFI